MIEKIFKKPASRTLNQDEAVSRGCALQCAILSQDIHFTVNDIQNYSVNITTSDDSRINSKEVFQALDAAPDFRLVLYPKPGIFQLMYSDKHVFHDPIIGKLAFKKKILIIASTDWDCDQTLIACDDYKGVILSYLHF